MEQQSLRFVNNYKDQPFCLSVSFKANHGPMTSDPAYDHLYTDLHIPLPETAADSCFEKLPDFFRQDSYARRGFQNAGESREKWDEHTRTTYRLLTGVDVMVGALVKELERLNIANNTIIIYMGDNGHMRGEHGLNGKWYGYDASIRVPLIVYDPRLPDKHKGQRIKKMALNIDIAPTILSYAGLDIPELMQGDDLSRLIENPETDWRTDFYYEQHYDRSVASDGLRIHPVEGVVGQRYKYMYYINNDCEELFDLKTDPDELYNRVDDPAYGKVLMTMRQSYQQKKQNLR